MTNEVKTLLAQDFFARITGILLDEAKGTSNNHLIAVAEILDNSVTIRNAEKFAELMEDEDKKKEYKDGKEKIAEFFEYNEDELVTVLNFDEILPIFEG